MSGADKSNISGGIFNDPVLTRVYDITKKHLCLVGDFKLTESLIEIGGDSLDQLEIIMEVEHEFGVQVADEKHDSLLTVRDISTEVTNLINLK